MKIKTGDKVMVIKGRDRGKTGTVLSADKGTNKVKVEGINIHKRHLKRATKPGVAGGITDMTLPISASNVMLIDPTTSRPTRIGSKVVGDKKMRIAKKSQSVIEDVKR